MAGLRGKQAWVGLGRQYVKGTPAPITHKAPFSGGSVNPDRSIAQLQETDSNRDEGVSYVEQVSASGTPEVYARDENIHSLLNAALGATVSSGSAPNYTHTITPANALPYMTFYRMIGATLYESFEDCLVNELTVSADTGGPLTVGVGIMGRQAKELAGTDPDAMVIPASGAVYNFNEATVTKGGVGTALISNMELTLSNNVTLQQTDDVIPYDVVAGMRSVTIGFDIIFETLADYKAFHYAGGTSQTNAIQETSLRFEFSKGANNSIRFDIDHAAYEEFPVEPDTGGDPIVVSARARAQRHPTDPVLESIVKNQKATVAA